MDPISLKDSYSDGAERGVPNQDSNSVPNQRGAPDGTSWEARIAPSASQTLSLIHI